MSSRIRRWIEEHWPLSALIRLGFEEEIPGSASYAYVFGSATLITFILQIITGICELRYYVPTLDHAYDGLNDLRIDVPFGWLIHGLHYWGANATVFLAGAPPCLHLGSLQETLWTDLAGGNKPSPYSTWDR